MEELPEDDPRRQSLEIISQEVERMAKLVRTLLQFSRRSYRQISTVDIPKELSNSLDLIEFYLRSRQVEVVREFAVNVPDIFADRQLLHQVFLNLITNASDAMPDGGTLTIRTSRGVLERDRPAVVVEFIDTGTGVPTGNLPKLWEPFFTTKPEGKGTGLGLAICRRTVEEHRGSISIDSAPGRGTTVRITLPTTEEGVASAA
jgi:signal transduction histidine kinase